MEAIDRKIKNGIVIESINIIRATMNEAHEIKEILMEDMLDHKKIIIDLSHCDYIDSTFFGAIVYAYRKMKEQGGSIILVINDTFMARSFIYEEIEKIFKVCHSLSDAIDEFNQVTEQIETDQI